MAKKRTKEIIPEKTPQKRGTDSYSYEKACNAAKNSGTPTYRFAVGDRVQVGHLPNCVVEEVMDDGAMYLIRVTTKDHVEYSCWAWTTRKWVSISKWIVPATLFAMRMYCAGKESP